MAPGPHHPVLDKATTPPSCYSPSASASTRFGCGLGGPAPDPLLQSVDPERGGLQLLGPLLTPRTAATPSA